MKTRTSGCAAVVALCLTCGACVNKQTGGAVAGAGIGAATGHAISKGSTAGTVIGGLLGALVGSEIGRSMDVQDQMVLSRALEHSPSQQRTQWINPDSGNAYSVTPVRSFTQAGGAPCRDFTMLGNVGMGQEELFGTACRQADGSWRVVNTQPAGVAGGGF